MVPISTARASLLIVLGACGFGSISIFVILGTRTGAPLVTLLALRYLLAAALLAVIAGGPRALALPRRRWVDLLLLGGGGQAVVTFTSLSALRWTSAATLAFLFYTYPAWVAVIAAIRRTEPFDRVRAAALVLSLSGITLMVGSPWTARVHPMGLVLGLGSALCYALYVPLIGRLSAGVVPAVAVAWIGMGAGALFLIGGLLTGTLALVIPAAAWAAAVGLAVFCTVVAFITFLRGLAVLGPVRTSIVATVEPFWTAIAAAVFLGQPLTATTAAGGVMIALAVALLQRPVAPPAAT
ncbi:MAG: hypothetical protein NVS1B4_02640 [Gemmatimonadaceae bacterium]